MSVDCLPAGASSKTGQVCRTCGWNVAYGFVVDDVEVVEDAAAVPFVDTVLLPPAETVLLPFGAVALADWVGCALPPDATTEGEEGSCDEDEGWVGRVRLRC